LKDVILTPEGYEKLKQEIEYLSNDKRREVAERIRTAREFGEIAENAEYDDAKNEQAMLEHKIAQLEERLLSARVITKKEISKDTVSVGSKVRIRDVNAKQTFEYHIVGSAEANPAENNSPTSRLSARRSSATRRATWSRWARRAGACSVPKSSCIVRGWNCTGGDCRFPP
jgi:transcription elongation factor GreA